MLWEPCIAGKVLYIWLSSPTFSPLRAIAINPRERISMLFVDLKLFTMSLGQICKSTLERAITLQISTYTFLADPLFFSFELFFDIFYLLKSGKKPRALGSPASPLLREKNPALFVIPARSGSN